VNESTPTDRPEVKPANQRGAARLAAVQALYQMDIGGTGLLEVVAEYEAHRLGREIDGDVYRQADAAWFRSIVSGVVEEQRTLDPVIAQALTMDWPLSRLDSTLRAILRAGTLELWKRQDVPVAVIVSEYVDIARAFYAGEEPKIVNGVLDRLARRYRPDTPSRRPRDADAADDSGSSDR
jgi:transcription antitermination protein NusB